MPAQRPSAFRGRLRCGRSCHGSREWGCLSAGPGCTAVGDHTTVCYLPVLAICTLPSTMQTFEGQMILDPCGGQRLTMRLPSRHADSGVAPNIGVETFSNPATPRVLSNGTEEPPYILRGSPPSC